MTPKNICFGFHNSGIYPFDRNKVQPTIMNNNQPSTKDDQKGLLYTTSIAIVTDKIFWHLDCTTRTRTEEFDEELYTRRLEEGYDIFGEKYVRWLLLNHPDKVCSDWLEKVSTSPKQPPQVPTGKVY